MAFHPYPRVIPSVFNLSGFGPPRGLTPASACPWVAHPASRLRRATRRPVRTRFRSGSLRGLTSPRAATRWLILQKARRHTGKPRAPTACRQAVSGTVSLPSRGAFHLSLAVLVRYRSQESIQGWRVDPPDSRRVSRARRYSGAGRRAGRRRVRGSYPVPPAFPGRSATASLSNRHVSGPTTPGRLGLPRFALGPRSLAATRGISF